MACNNNDDIIVVPNGEETDYSEFATQLTDNTNDKRPSWNISGTKIAFERLGNIYTIELTYYTLNFVGRGHSPSWSTDEDYISLIRDGEVYMARDAPGYPTTKKTTGAYIDYASGCDWGLGNRLVYFHMVEAGEPDSLTDVTYINRLMTVNPYTNIKELLYNQDLGYSKSPQWAPFGSKICFQSKLHGICIYDLQQSLLKSVVYWGNPGNPSWYSDNDTLYIIFTEQGKLFRINEDGTNRIVLIEKDFHPGSISFCFRKKRVAFSHRGIWVMDTPVVVE